MKNDNELLNSDNLIQDMRNRANKKRNEIYENLNSTKEEKKYADDVIKVLSNEENLLKIPKSVIFAVFLYLDYTSDDYVFVFYNQLYHKVMDEVNRTYTLVDLETQVRK